jgi:hypothetical protein
MTLVLRKYARIVMNNCVPALSRRDCRNISRLASVLLLIVALGEKVNCTASTIVNLTRALSGCSGANGFAEPACCNDDRSNGGVLPFGEELALASPNTDGRAGLLRFSFLMGEFLGDPEAVFFETLSLGEKPVNKFFMNSLALFSLFEAFMLECFSLIYTEKLVRLVVSKNHQDYEAQIMLV